MTSSPSLISVVFIIIEPHLVGYWALTLSSTFAALIFRSFSFAYMFSKQWTNMQKCLQNPGRPIICHCSIGLPFVCSLRASHPRLVPSETGLVSFCNLGSVFTSDGGETVYHQPYKQRYVSLRDSTSNL